MIMNETETTTSIANVHINERNYHSTNDEIFDGPIKRGWDLTFFASVSIFTALSAISCVLLQILALITLKFSVVSLIIRLYSIALAVSIVTIEVEVAASDLLRNFFVIQSWSYRGMFYIFVGFLLLLDDDSYLATNNAVVKFVNISSICLMVSGFTYIAMGLLCLKPIKDRKMARYIQLLSQAEIQRAIRDRDDSLEIRL